MCGENYGKIKSDAKTRFRSSQIKCAEKKEKDFGCIPREWLTKKNQVSRLEGSDETRPLRELSKKKQKP